MSEYTVKENDLGSFAVLRDDEVIGVRPKYKAAQRLAEATAGRQLDWENVSRGVYIGRKSE